jgi:hypothetical protein
MAAKPEATKLPVPDSPLSEKAEVSETSPWLRLIAPLSQPVDPSKLTEVKGLKEPPCHDGRDHTWAEFDFKFVSWCGLLGLDDLLVAASNHKSEIQMTALEAPVRQQSKTLFYIMTQVLQGKSLAIVRNVADRNGLEAYRQLKMEYQPDAIERHLAVYGGLMVPKWSPWLLLCPSC